MRSYAAKALYNLPKNLVWLPVIGIQFMSEILPRLHLVFFTVSAADFRASAYHECKEKSALL